MPEATFMDKNLERFFTYAKIDTQSDENSVATPSQEKELNLTKELLKELGEMGIKGSIDEYGRLYAFYPGEASLPVIGLNSHVDTALECSGKNVKPTLIKHYDGKPIKLNRDFTMTVEQFPSLGKHLGDDLVVTDGTTLLGADDKAGLAIIMATLSYYTSHPQEKHHPIAILFTPDEEIGRGPEHFDAKKFGAAFAYTIDGDYPDIVNIENFNAAHAIVEIQGVSIHPGEAKGKMVNAIRLAEEFDALLDPNEKPELTEGHEGFNHILSFEANEEKATTRYIIRNHDLAKLEHQKDEFKKAAAILKAKYPTAEIKLTLADDYRNMKEVLDKDPRAVQHAAKVYGELGIKIRYEPIRGGTDGATFSFLGCPTPNLGTGSYNHHGRFEYLSVRDFNQMIAIVEALVKA
jgi:tripeptide aminopeptidase